MNKQSGFNAEQINKDKNPKSKNRLKIKSEITSYHNRTKTVRLSTSNHKRSLHISQSFPLSSETYAWLLVSKLTTCVTSQALNWEIIFLPIWFFSSLNLCWFFIRGGECCMPPSYVPYKGTYVPYNGTFGMPDQGQTLDVWESQTAKSALRDDWPWIVPRHTLEVVLEVTLEHMCTGLRPWHL